MANEYVFVSYAHKDTDAVLPCVEAMKQKNINVWYDEGIQAGSEWPEYIAEKVVSCTKFVLFMSRAYLESQNCKRELNFAISKKKDLLSVFIEDVELSPGVEMQLGTYQSIFKNRFSTDGEFFESLGDEPWFDACRTKGASKSLEVIHTNTAAPAQQHIPPLHQYTKPSQQHIPPVQQYARPAQQHIPPVQQYAKPQQYAPPVQPNAPYQTVPPQGAPSLLPRKNRMVAAMLALFLGIFGVHSFYLNNPLKGFICLLFFWTTIPGFIGFFEGFKILAMTNEIFAQKYNCRT